MTTTIILFFDHILKIVPTTWEKKINYTKKILQIINFIQICKLNNMYQNGYKNYITIHRWLTSKSAIHNLILLGPHTHFGYNTRAAT